MLHAGIHFSHIHVLSKARFLQVLFCQLTAEQISQYKQYLKSDDVEKAMGEKREV